MSLKRDIAAVRRAMGMAEAESYVMAEFIGCVRRAKAANADDIAKLADDVESWLDDDVSDETLREWAPLYWQRRDDDRRICSEETRRAS